MRYVLKLEAIGDNYSAYLRHYLKSDSKDFGRKELQAFSLGNKRFTPWVALIVGLDGYFGFKRDFVEGHRDYSGASSTGSRGIFIYYALKPGIYEINDRQTWKRVDRYFCRIENDETLVRISKEEVIRCFKNES